jgi:hypothetical protein
MEARQLAPSANITPCQLKGMNWENVFIPVVVALSTSIPSKAIKLTFNNFFGL